MVQSFATHISDRMEKTVSQLQKALFGLNLHLTVNTAVSQPLSYPWKAWSDVTGNHDN